MAPILVGIDLGQSHIRVGGLVLTKYIVAQGTKDIKVNGPQAPSRGEVVEVFHDVNQVVKSYFGAPHIQAAVVVVPNSTSFANREAVADAGRGAGYNIVQVIDEHTAVAAAYAEIVKPTAGNIKRLAIVSVTGGVLDVSIISVKPEFEFVLEAQETHLEPIEFEEQESSNSSGPGGLFGFVGGVVKTLVVDPLDKAFDIAKKLLSSPKLSSESSPVDEIILVGKAAKSEKLKQAVKERFPNARVWSPAAAAAAEEVAAYGAGVIAYKQIPVHETNKASLSPFDQGDLLDNEGRPVNEEDYNVSAGAAEDDDDDDDDEKGD